MGWNQKGKFGIRTGRTLRRNYPSSQYCCSRDAYCCCPIINEYVVVKEIKFNDPIGRLSFDKNSVNKLGIDDGGLSFDDSSMDKRKRLYPSMPMIYSMNKRKRWLLPDIVKQDVEQLYWEEMSRLEQTATKQSSRKACKRMKTEDSVSHKPRVSVVERHAGSTIERGHPDCVGVTSSSPCLNPEKPLRKPRKWHAFVGDLKSTASNKDDVELCYEFLSPFPKQSWPTNRQLCAKKISMYLFAKNLSGKKSSKKSKGRKNKWYMRPDLDKDDGILTNNDENTVAGEESAIWSSKAYSFPLGAYIEDMLVFGSNKGAACQAVNTSKVVSSISPTLYGKGDAIFVDKESSAISYEHIDDDFKSEKPTTKLGPILKDEMK